MKATRFVQTILLHNSSDLVNCRHYGYRLSQFLFSRSRFTAGFAIIFSSLLLFSACGEDDYANEDLLLGRWDIQQGLRNGRATESLDELFFVFYEEGKMQTNISGNPADVTYELDGDQIHQQGGPLDITYNIESLTDSMLVLTTTINQYDFRLEMARTVLEE